MARQDLTREFVGVWIDSLSTGILSFRGTRARDGKTINFGREYPDLAEGRYKKSRSDEHMGERQYVRLGDIRDRAAGEEWAANSH